MLVAKTNQSNYVVAYETEKVKGLTFTCPGCNHPVVLKKGKVTIHHFAHKPGSDCAYGRGETEVHLRCKDVIYRSLKKLAAAGCDICDIALERPVFGFDGIRDSRADVFATINGCDVAFEVQHSPINADVIHDRTMRYAAKGVYVCWILPEPCKPHRATKMETCFDEMYGCLFLLDCDLELLQVMDLDWRGTEPLTLISLDQLVAVQRRSMLLYTTPGHPSNIKQLPQNLRAHRKDLESVRPYSTCDYSGQLLHEKFKPITFYGSKDLNKRMREFWGWFAYYIKETVIVYRLPWMWFAHAESVPIKIKIDHRLRLIIIGEYVVDVNKPITTRDIEMLADLWKDQVLNYYPADQQESALTA